jgi:aryl-alcohol dehydrogenase-like predicted oxidoreductase
MDAAWELGITHFDTADAYGGGRSESMIGRWMRSRGRRPTITTKTYNPMADGADHGLHPARIERQLESSLDRLGVEHVELYLAHEFDPEVPIADTFGALDALKAAGKLAAYGVSNFDQRQLELALQAGPPQAIQNARSLLDRADDALLELCAEHGVAYIAFGPLSGGWLAGRYRRGQPYPTGSRMTMRPEPYRHLDRQATFDALEQLETLARTRGQSLPGLALAWLLDDERVTQIVLGPSRPEHLAPLSEALSNPLTPDERAHIEGLVAC